jgi:hypothetical protein
MKRATWIIIIAVVLIGGYTYYTNQQAKEQARIEALEIATKAAAAKSAEEEAAKAAMVPPFGSETDVAFATRVWAAMQAQGLGSGPDALRTVLYEGTDPHGMQLETFFSSAEVDGRVGDLVVKRNYGPAGVDPDLVRADPEKYLGSLTVMFRREAGFDEETKNWFWVKFLPDGSLDKNPKGRPLAGLVAKGASAGCIACHGSADGGDFVFTSNAYR